VPDETLSFPYTASGPSAGGRVRIPARPRSRCPVGTDVRQSRSRVTSVRRRSRCPSWWRSRWPP